MSGSLLTPERWEEARRVLQAEDPAAVSLSAAARAAGVPLAELQRWIRRSQARDPTDEAWVHEIAEVVSEYPGRQHDRLKDVLWSRAMGGDRAAILRMLERLQPEEWKPAPKQAVTVVMDKSEARERIRAVLAIEGSKPE